MKKVFTLITIILSVALSHAQDYGYKLVDSWQASIVIERYPDAYEVIGLGLDSSHFILHSSLDKYFEIKDTHKFKFNHANTSLQPSFCFYESNQEVIISGLISGENNSYWGMLCSLSESGIELVDTYSVAWRTFPIQTFWKDSTYSSFGVYVNDSAELKTHINTYLAVSGPDSFIKYYGCNGFGGNGGCEFVLRQVVQLESGYLLVGDARAYYERSGMIDPLIIKIDGSGNEQWRLRLDNDSTSGFNVVVAPLANGNFLATYMDYQWKPKRKPPEYDNRNPELNESTNIQCVIFNQDGQILDQYDFAKEMRFIDSDGIHSAWHNHLIQTKDSAIVIVGNTLDKGTNGDYLGYILKLDKFGQYQWYRHLELNINGSPGKKERLYINGVTELKNGGFALAGEYRSEQSDSFPFGTQAGVMILTDEFGCMKPGCELKDNIQEVRKNDFVTVSPNPSSGTFNVKSRLPSQLYMEIYNTVGQQVYHQEFTGTTSILLSHGIYIAHFVDPSTGARQNRRIIIQ